MTIDLITTIAGPKGVRSPGFHDVSDEEGNALIAAGSARAGVRPVAGGKKHPASRGAIEMRNTREAETLPPATTPPTAPAGISMRSTSPADGTSRSMKLGRK